MVLDAAHHPEAAVQEPEDRSLAADPVAKARRMSAVAHQMVLTTLEDILGSDDDVFDDELGLRDLHNPTGEDG